tara:strand:- start:12869 stop:13054 length:186 start_codon:yes stop_codon:yes gene_type:complete
MKCKTPLRCRPEFEGKYHCKRCSEEARIEAEKLLDLIDKRVPFRWIQTSGTGLDDNWGEEE